MNISTTTATWPYRYGVQSSDSTSSSTVDTQGIFQSDSQQSSQENSIAALDSQSAASFFSGQMNQGLMPPSPPEGAMAVKNDDTAENQQIASISQQRISQAIQAYENS